VKRAAVLVIAACSRDAVTTCSDDLRGVYTVLSMEPHPHPGALPAGAMPRPSTASTEDLAGGERWMVLDDGATLEAYPLFPDGGHDPALEIAPRVIDLARGADGIAGTLRRRYLRRADVCEARQPIHVTRCAANLLELVLADPSPPTSFAPCTWPRPAASRVERWLRE